MNDLVDIIGTIGVSEYRNLVKKRESKPSIKLGKTSKRGNKFNNIVSFDEDGNRFDSKKELEEWKRLRMLFKNGAIQNLERQVKFSFDLNGVHIANYFADFVYLFKEKKYVVDVKGVVTPSYRMKKKMMKAFHGINITEIK